MGTVNLTMKQSINIAEEHAEDNLAAGTDKERFNEAIILFQECLDGYIALGVAETLLGGVCRNMAVAYYAKGKYVKALDHCV